MGKQEGFLHRCKANRAPRMGLQSSNRPGRVKKRAADGAEYSMRERECFSHKFGMMLKRRGSAFLGWTPGQCLTGTNGSPCVPRKQTVSDSPKVFFPFSFFFTFRVFGRFLRISPLNKLLYSAQVTSLSLHNDADLWIACFRLERLVNVLRRKINGLGTKGDDIIDWWRW